MKRIMVILGLREVFNRKYFRTHMELFGQCLFDCGLNIGLRIFRNSLVQELEQFILNNIMLAGHK